MKKTDILDVLSRKLAPFILLFGLYLITYGHLSPGGGFQGGVALASGMILLLLCQGPERLQQLFSMTQVGYVEALGFLVFLLVGLVGLLVGAGYLGNFFPKVPGEKDLGAGMILLLNVIIGLKVGAGMTLICYYLFIKKEEG